MQRWPVSSVRLGSPSPTGYGPSCHSALHKPPCNAHKLLLSPRVKFGTNTEDTSKSSREDRLNQSCKCTTYRRALFMIMVCIMEEVGS